MYDKRKELKDRLRSENFVPEVPRELTDLVFRKAWSDGHASGEHEVAQQYRELADIARYALSVGQAHGRP